MTRAVHVVSSDRGTPTHPAVSLTRGEAIWPPLIPTQALPFPRAGRWLGRARGVLRLLLLLVLTLASNLTCRIRRRTSRRPRAAALAVTQALARSLVRMLGVRVTYGGSRWRGFAVYVANHRSYTDVPLLMAENASVFLAKAEIGEWPVIGAATRLAGTVFVRRDELESRKAALGELRELLLEGQPVTVFPEGTTSTGPGMQPFRPGVFRLAAELGVAVVPVAIVYGSREDAWIGDDDFVRHFLDRFGNPQMAVAVEFGPPIRPLHHQDGERLKEAAEQWIVRSLDHIEKGIRR